ncbi:MAG: hypothetical protein A2Y15_08460 [Clostridiales bacterium GWF2_36_10]|nr:MAG: hypothetical protein A2Y15_08460 [Clostridiales bacterium GWF2_36_10]HAN21801.1 hypothetical protein [Clostridiales bacterium]
MKYNKNWFYKLDYKYRKYAIRNFMSFIVGGMAIIFVMSIMMASSGINLIGALTFDKSEIMNGQIWRIVSFIYIPPDTSTFFIIFALYFYWLIGNSLEHEWGALKFNVFYIFGIIGTITGGIIMGSATNSFLNLSLFLAFAILFPEFEVRLFFMIPVKVKWLAYIDVVYLIYAFIISEWTIRIAILISIINIILFFWNTLLNQLKRIFRNRRHKFQTRNYWKQK